MGEVTSIALSDDYIRRLTEILQKDFIGKNIPLEKVALVFGGKRPSLFLRRELSRQINTAYFPPAVFSMDEFIKEVVRRKSSVKMVSRMDSAYSIYKLAKAGHPELLAGRESFAMFLPWAEEINAFIEQLDLEEINDDKLRSVQENAKIGFDTLKEINLLLADIIKLRKEFHEAFKKENSLTRGMLYMSAAECAKEVNFDDFEVIIFCGFFYLHKTEQRLIKELLGREKAKLIFQGDESEWDVLKGLSKVFSKAVIAEEAQIKNKPKINFYRGFDMHSQIAILREKLKEIKNTEETLILLANPDALVPLLSDISSLGAEFNVSIGYSLKRSSVYSLFQDIFAAQLSRKLENKLSYYYSRDYLKVLSHPFLKNLDISGLNASRVVVHKTEEILTGTIENDLAGELFISLDKVSGSNILLEEIQGTLRHMDIKVSLDDIAMIFKKLNELAFEAWEGISNFYEFSVSVENIIIALLQMSTLEKYALNLKAAQKILELVEELRSATFSQEKFSQEEMFKIFTQRLENEMVSFSGSPLRGMQVLGLLETRSLTFKNVIVMDVNESILPKLRIYEPLIPRDVMVSLGIERLEKEEEIQRYQFSRLISAADNVHLIYREDRETIRSRFLEDLIWREEQKQGKVGVVEIPLFSFNIKALPKKAIAKKTKDMIADLKKRVFSVSSVNMYISCPLKFYFRYCLGLEEKEDLFDEPEAADVGTFVHRLLEDAFRGFMNKKPVINKKFEETFFGEFEKLFKEEFGRKMKADSFILEDIIRHRMEKFLESEKQRNDIDAVVMLEKKLPWKIETKSGIFNFTAGVDRVDRLSDDSLLVIDYKTGSAALPNVNLSNMKFSRNEIKKSIKSFQLPIYIWACREYLNKEDVRAAIYFLRTCEIKEYLQKNTPEKKAESLDTCFNALSFILDEIVNPNTVFEADIDTQRNCAYCPYSALCR